MSDIKDRIKKLLALGQSPNENEARDALLKARDLMMKYKISETEFEEKKDAKMEHLLCREISWTTDGGRVWMTDLCNLIANKYLCVAAWHTPHGTRTHTLMLTGLEDDVHVCKEVMKYAVGFVNSAAIRLTVGKTAEQSKVVINSYARGFIMGLEMAFEDQEEAHEEWSLAIIKPQEVKAYEDTLGTRSVRTRKTNVDPLAYIKGQKDGQNFNTKSVLTAGCQ